MKKLLLGAVVLLSGCGQSQSFLSESSSDKQQADLLFDQSHGVTAGEADWVIDGAFSSFYDALKNEGMNGTANEYNSVLTLAQLKKYKGLILPEPNIPFKESEQKAIVDYVKSGGSVMMISDHYNADRNLNRLDASEIFNGYRRGHFKDMTNGMTQEEKSSERMQGVKSSDFLNENFGVRFRYNALDDIVINTNQQDNVFGLLDGVKSVNMHAGSTIMITNPNIAKGIIYPGKLMNRNRWAHAVDQGVYSSGNEDEGAFIAISKIGKGKAVFIGDSSIVEDETPKYLREDNGQQKNTYDGINEADHKALLLNLVNWMTKQENYTTFKDKIALSSKTKVLSQEQPENSVEPKQEPWGEPSNDYLWYDNHTFHEGSFGAINRHSNQLQTHDNHLDSGEIKIQKPDHVSPGAYFKIDLFTEKAVDNITIELVDSDNEQVGLFNGRPPGKSNAYDTRQKNGVYSCYFNGKIAREANGNITIIVKNNNKILKRAEMSVK